METYGEDPFLTGSMAVPFIRGLQGYDAQGNAPHYLKTIATAKHYAVHSGPESTRHVFDAEDQRARFARHVSSAISRGDSGRRRGFRHVRL